MITLGVGDCSITKGQHRKAPNLGPFRITTFQGEASLELRHSCWRKRRVYTHDRITGEMAMVRQQPHSFRLADLPGVDGHASTIPRYWTTDDRSPRQTSSLFHGSWGEWSSSSGAVEGRSFGAGCGFMNPSCFATTASSILAGRSLGKVQFLKRWLMTA